MRKRQSEQPAQITVFVSMALAVILTLLCTSLESARVSALRYFIRTAAESSVFSVFSEYHRGLLDRYHLFFLKDDGNLEQSIKEYLSCYEIPSTGLMMRGMNLYPFGTDGVWMENTVYAPDQGALPVESEIMEYMKYGMAESLLDQIKDKLHMGSQSQEMMKAMDQITALSGEVADLENQYSQLKENTCDLQAAAKNATAGYQDIKRLVWEKTELKKKADVLEQLQDEPGSTAFAIVQPELNRIRENLGRVYGQLNAAVEQAEQKEAVMGRMMERSGLCLERIRQSTEELKIRMEPPITRLEQLKPQLSEEFQRAADQQTQAVKAYTEENGERKALAAEIGRKIEELQAELDRLPGTGEIAGKEPDEAESLLDAREVCISQKTVFLETDQLQTVEKPMESRLLEKIGDLKNKGILALVTDPGETLSSRQIEEAGLPSRQAGQAEEEAGAGDEEGLQRILSGLTEGLYKRLCLSEYAVKTMPSYIDSRVSDSQTQDEIKEGFYDLEYILGGSVSDQENLVGAIEKLLLIREGMNLIYLLSDREKSEEAQLLAAAITGALGLTPLAGLVKLMILAAWAFAESVTDVRCLLREGKVPFFKQKADWKTSLERAADMAADGQTGLEIYGNAEDENQEKGMNYQAYLRLLLCITSNEKKLYRCMDMIQWNIQRKEPDFYLKNCIYQTAFHLKIQAAKLFVTFPLVRMGAEADGTYRFETVEERGYGESFSGASAMEMDSGLRTGR